MDGTKLPSVTTILSRFKDSGGLIHWAFKQGQANPDTRSPYDKEKAADIGTLAHGMVESYINGVPFSDHILTVEKTVTLPFSDEPEIIECKQFAGMEVDDEMIKKAENAFEMFLEWLDMTNITLIGKWQEKKLISERYGYGGTPDCIGQLPNGKLVLIDWKTSNSIYSDYLVQCAAYIQAWNENCDIGCDITGGAYICRFSKEHPDFSTFYAKDLTDETTYFNMLLECYRISKGIDKRCK